MKMFLWSVGSFHVFGKQLDFVSKTLPKKSQSGFPTFQIDVQMPSSIISKVAKGFIFFPGRAAAQGSLCPPFGGLGAGGGLQMGRRIKCSQKCVFSEGYPQKQLAFRALALLGVLGEANFCRYLWYSRAFC